MRIIIVCLFMILFLSPAEAQPLIKNMDFVDAQVLDVVRVLAGQAGLDLVISGDSSLAQTKRTTLHLEDINVEEAIDYVLKTNGLTYEKKGKAILISMLPQIQGEGGEVCVMSLTHLSADKVSSLLAKVLPALKTTVGGRANVVVLKGAANLIDEAKKIIFSIDHPVPQILIESKVLEISESDSMRLNLSFGTQAGVIELSSDLQVTLNALISSGKAKVVATPKIATLDDHEAVINIGSRIPYAVPVSNGSEATQWAIEYIDAGVKLKVTPRLGKENYITTFIQPEVSSISEWRTTSAGEFPVISTRNAQATLRVKDGETIVVGGLLSETDRENVSKLPILGYLPVIGSFFQNRTIEKAKTEIVFLITPYII